MKKLLMTAGAAVLALGTAASAATLSISGGTAGSIPGGGVNNVLADLLGVSSLSGFYGSEIVANAGANSKIKVEVMGYEALFLNEFSTAEDSFTTSGGAPKKVIGDPNPLATWLTDASGGLDFAFTTFGNGVNPAQVKSVANGDTNTEATTLVNFFAHDDGKYIWLFFDDAYENDDDNHDDLVVRLSAVPLPAGALLLLTGMGALALRRRAA